MGELRKWALAGGLALTLAAPAGAATVVLTTPSGKIAGTGYYDLTSYLSDAQGRTFAITAARLSLQAYSDIDYAPPTTSTSTTWTCALQDPANPQVVGITALSLTTITYADAVADSMTLSNGFITGGQSVSGAVSQTLETSKTVDLGVSDGPATVPPFNFGGGVLHRTTYQETTIHRAIYGALNLDLDFDATSLAQVNSMGVAFFTLGASPGGFDFNLGGFVPPSQFSRQDVSLTFDLAQTGGPPLSAPVPEPATWAMMLMGFGGLGAALRRRRFAPA